LIGAVAVQGLTGVMNVFILNSYKKQGYWLAVPQHASAGRIVTGGAASQPEMNLEQLQARGRRP
jgi:hypothetical protein